MANTLYAITHTVCIDKDKYILKIKLKQNINPPIFSVFFFQHQQNTRLSIDVSHRYARSTYES